MLSGEATYNNFIVFGLALPGLETTIYHTGGKHTNHYATDAVMNLCVVQDYIKKRFKIPKGLSEAVHRRTDNTNKKTIRKAMIDKSL